MLINLCIIPMYVRPKTAFLLLQISRNSQLHVTAIVTILRLIMKYFTFRHAPPTSATIKDGRSVHKTVYILIGCQGQKADFLILGMKFYSTIKSSFCSRGQNYRSKVTESHYIRKVTIRNALCSGGVLFICENYCESAITINLDRHSRTAVKQYWPAIENQTNFVCQ